MVLAALLWPREREPEYNRVRLSEWLERAGRLMRTRPRPVKPVHSWSEGTGSEFNRAIRHMGTNALPGLLRAVQYQTPAWRRWLHQKLWFKLPATMTSCRPMQWLSGQRGYDISAGAIAAFGILGDDARPVLDDLKRIASRNDGNGFRAYLAIREMGYGPQDLSLDPHRVVF